MLPHPDSLTLPFREGVRDLRSSIRFEARAGGVSSRLLGTPEPTRRLARFADGLLTRAEAVAVRVLPRGETDPGARLDRLAAAARAGRLADRSADLYALCRAILDLDAASGALVSEMRLATGEAGAGWRTEADPTLAAVRAAAWMASLGIVRPCLSTFLTRSPDAAGKDLDHRVAMTLWLAVLVRAESREDGHSAIEGARLAVDAEGEEWAQMLRRRRFEDLADAWRRTVPYLP